MDKYLPYILIGGGVLVVFLLVRQSPSQSVTEYAQPRTTSFAPLPSDPTFDQIRSQERLARLQIAGEAFNTLLNYNLGIEGLKRGSEVSQRDFELERQRNEIDREIAQLELNQQFSDRFLGS